MATFFSERYHLSQGDMVVVDCDHQCNIRLIDDKNFEKFKRGEQHRYYGGFYRMLPARLVVPRSGDWNVVLDLGWRTSSARYSISPEGRSFDRPAEQRNVSGATRSAF